MSTLVSIAAQSQLVVVDIQTKLTSAMPPDAAQAMIKNVAILLQAANALAVDSIVTEQYPQGLGETVPELKARLSADQVISKTTFSCCHTPRFAQRLHRDKPQLVLVGQEAHICVLQTALDLTQSNKQVFVVEDAVISRNPANKANAIARMRDAGCIITNTESVLFEWLGDAKHPEFKTISKLII